MTEVTINGEKVTGKLHKITIMDIQERKTGRANNFKDLPSQYKSIKDRLISSISHHELDSFYGLTESVPVYRVYHATVDTKLPAIQQEGLKAFYEQDRDRPRIFITPSPTLALWHAIENKPHDTLRKKGVLTDNVAEGNPVLLLLQINKDWLKQQNDVKKPLDTVEYMRLLAEEEDIGSRKPEDVNRLQTFFDVLRSEVNELKQGKEATNLGIPLPVDSVPPEFIFVDNGISVVPVSDFINK